MMLRGAAALITGSASGIGRATALALAERGARRIWLADVNEAGLEEVSRQLSDLGCEGVRRPIDIADPVALQALFEEAASQDSLELVFNNAGIASGPVSFPRTPPARIAALVNVNVTAVLIGTQLAAQQMMSRGRGVIVNMSSIAVVAPTGNDIAYTATKAAVLSLSQVCAPALAAQGVRIHAILPSLVRTPLLMTTGDGVMAPWLMRALADGKVLEPEDVAAAVLKLAEGGPAEVGQEIHKSDEGADGSRWVLKPVPPGWQS